MCVCVRVQIFSVLARLGAGGLSSARGREGKKKCGAAVVHVSVSVRWARDQASRGQCLAQD